MPNVLIEQYVESEPMGGRVYRLIMPEWLAMEKGLI